MLSIADINRAEQNGIPLGTLRERMNRGWDKERAITEPTNRTKKTYAVYQGGVELCRGSAKECADTLGLKTKTVKWYSTDVHHNRVKEKGTQHKSKVAFVL